MGGLGKMNYKEKYMEALETLKEKVNSINDTETREFYLQLIQKIIADNDNFYGDIENTHPAIDDMLYNLELVHIEGMISSVNKILNSEDYNTRKIH